MTAAVAHIIDEMEQLTPAERVELRRHIVEHLPVSDVLVNESASGVRPGFGSVPGIELAADFDAPLEAFADYRA